MSVDGFIEARCPVINQVIAEPHLSSGKELGLMPSILIARSASSLTPGWFERKRHHQSWGDSWMAPEWNGWS
jgi:hypothetical protein